MEIVTKEQFSPICPHCNKELNEIHRKKEVLTGTLLQPISIYACPHCSKVLSITTWYSW